jgi:hypothetical protein
MSSDIANSPPCRGCAHEKEDKEPVDSFCYKCEKRILYDLSLIDPRLIPSYIESDKKRISELKRVDIATHSNSKINSMHYDINYRLKKQAKKAGWEKDYISWLWHMHKDRHMTISDIAKKTKINSVAIIKRLNAAGFKTIQWRKSDEPTKICQECGEIMYRKRFSNSIESRYHFSKRRFCSISCFTKYKRKQKEKKNDHSN